MVLPSPSRICYAFDRIDSIRRSCGYRIAAIMRPCQGRDGGSTPPTRSNKNTSHPRGVFVYSLPQKCCHKKTLDPYESSASRASAIAPSRVSAPAMNRLRWANFAPGTPVTAVNSSSFNPAQDSGSSLRDANPLGFKRIV